MNFREKGCPSQIPAGIPNTNPIKQFIPGYNVKAPVQPIPTTPQSTHHMAMHPITPVPPTPQQPLPEETGTLNLFPVDEGFVKGTIYRGIYRPYKNYQPMMVMPTNEKARMMFDVDKNWFGLHEIRMYLDNYPNDREAINVYNQFKNGYINAKKAYEARFGAIGEDAETLNASPFNWTVGTWPWDGGM